MCCKEQKFSCPLRASKTMLQILILIWRLEKDCLPTKWLYMAYWWIQETYSRNLKWLWSRMSTHVVRLTTWVLCGLLKSKYNYIWWGFLFVVENFLMQCKFLLKNNLHHANDDGIVNHDFSSERLNKSNAIIRVMNSSLLLVVSTNGIDCINVLKVLPYFTFFIFYGFLAKMLKLCKG